MKIKVLFDKRAMNDDLRVGWGVSFLVGENTLFDTGENGEWLVENMRVLGVNVERIRNIVISHDHWDHTGGLWKLLSLIRNVSLYICPGFSKEFKAKVRSYGANVIEVSRFTSISDEIAVTGEIKSVYKGSFIAEQALVIKEGEEVSVLTGCSHPGIVNVLSGVRSFLGNRQFHLVMGGFHLLNEEKIVLNEVLQGLMNLNVRYVGATHCTGEEAEAIFREKYGKNFIDVRVGLSFDTISLSAIREYDDVDMFGI